MHFPIYSDKNGQDGLVFVWMVLRAHDKLSNGKRFIDLFTKFSINSRNSASPSMEFDN